MGLFSKKISLEEIKKAVADLSEEEKAELTALLNPEEEATETETPAETVEETTEEATEETETPAEETEEATAEETETETEAAPEAEAEPEAQPEAQPEAEAEADETTQDDTAEENAAQIIESLTGRVNDLEAKLSDYSAQIDSLVELKAKLDEYEAKTADKFGYRQNGIADAGKDIRDMTTAELKEKQAIRA